MAAVRYLAIPMALVGWATYVPQAITRELEDPVRTYNWAAYLRKSSSASWNARSIPSLPDCLLDLRRDVFCLLGFSRWVATPTAGWRAGRCSWA